MARSAGTVVVVDDNEVALAYVQDVLESVGFSVKLVTSPFSVSRALREHRPDVVLIDVTMPALQGDKLVEVIRRHNLHDCALVLYSDRSAAELDELSKACGANGYIQKSIADNRFCEIVAGYCAKTT